jgi:hypothetical protein
MKPSRGLAITNEGEQIGVNVDGPDDGADVRIFRSISLQDSVQSSAAGPRMDPKRRGILHFVQSY